VGAHIVSPPPGRGDTLLFMRGVDVAHAQDCDDQSPWLFLTSPQHDAGVYGYRSVILDTVYPSPLTTTAPAAAAAAAAATDDADDVTSMCF